MVQLVSIRSKGENPYVSFDLKIVDQKLLSLEVNARTQSGESIYIEWMTDSLVVKRVEGEKKELYILTGSAVPRLLLNDLRGISEDELQLRLKVVLRELINELEVSSKTEFPIQVLVLVKKLIDEVELYVESFV